MPNKNKEQVCTIVKYHGTIDVYLNIILPQILKLYFISPKFINEKCYGKKVASLYFVRVYI